MKVLMLGWEYPPKISGGLGVASQGIAESLANIGHEVNFLLPKKSPRQTSRLIKITGASSLKPNLQLWKKEKKHIETLTEVSFGHRLVPYLPPETFEIAKEKQKVITTLEPTTESELLENIKLTGEYSGELTSEIVKYALLAAQHALKSKPDIIHAHDWITFKAGIKAKELTGKPLFVHMHSTEQDRNGNHAQGFVIEEEKRGLERADHIFCVSHKLKRTIIEQYHVSQNKITVVPNSLNLERSQPKNFKPPKHIAFVGRLTPQKNPFKFVEIAREMNSRGHQFNYSIIGDGYLMHDLKTQVHGTSTEKYLEFTGFLHREELLKKLNDIDLLIMPSASEPFGLVALEAILKGIPVAATQGSGIAEFVPSIPQVEPWDMYSFCAIVEKLMVDINYRSGVIANCSKEASRLTWKQSAAIMEKAYQLA